jgi:hypothetical protein
MVTFSTNPLPTFKTQPSTGLLPGQGFSSKDVGVSGAGSIITSTGRAGSSVRPAPTPTSSRPEPVKEFVVKPLAKPVPVDTPIEKSLATGQEIRRTQAREALRAEATGLRGIVSEEEIRKAPEIRRRRIASRQTIEKDIETFGQRAFRTLVGVKTPRKQEIQEFVRRSARRRTAAKQEFRREALAKTPEEILEAQRFGTQFAAGAGEAVVTFVPSIPISIRQIVEQPIETGTRTVQFAVEQPGRFAGGTVASAAITGGLGRGFRAIKSRVAPPTITEQFAGAKVVIEPTGRMGVGEVIVRRAKGKPTRARFGFTAEQLPEGLVRTRTAIQEAAPRGFRARVKGLAKPSPAALPEESVTRQIGIGGIRRGRQKIITAGEASLQRTSDVASKQRIAVAELVADVDRVQTFKGLTTGLTGRTRPATRPVTTSVVQVGRLAKGPPTKVFRGRPTGTVLRTDAGFTAAASAAQTAIEQTVRVTSKPGPSVPLRAAPVVSPVAITRRQPRQEPITIQRPSGPPSRFPTFEQRRREPPGRVDQRLSRDFDASQSQLSRQVGRTIQRRPSRRGRIPARLSVPSVAVAQRPGLAQRRGLVTRQRTVQQQRKEQRRERILLRQQAAAPKPQAFASAAFAASNVGEFIQEPPQPSKRDRRLKGALFRFFVKQRRIRAPAAVARV